MGCPTEFELVRDSDNAATETAGTSSSTGESTAGAGSQGETGPEGQDEAGNTEAEGEQAEEAEDIGEEEQEEGEEAEDVDEEEDFGEEEAECDEDEGWELCEGNNECVDLNNSEFHCGECGMVCRLGDCIEGECLRYCDLDSGEDNGGCDVALEFCDIEDEDSQEGFCHCRPGFENCGGTCKNLENDRENCGGCGELCEPGFSCFEGDCEPNECVEDDDDDNTLCSGACVDIEFDPLNCGECGRRCEFDALCFGGECFDVEYVHEEECDACPCFICEEIERLPICCETELEDFSVVCVEDNEEIEEFCDG